MISRRWKFRGNIYFGVSIHRIKNDGNRYLEFEREVETTVANKFLGKLLELGAEVDDVAFDTFEIELSYYPKGT